eukprot:47028-Eustigmatos_ZCMA.PRE.1
MKPDGSWRFTVDYRCLNTLTTPTASAYPLPRIDEVLDTLEGAQYFSKVDLVQGFFGVQMEES